MKGERNHVQPINIKYLIHPPIEGMKERKKRKKRKEEV